jgi:hypothetical protein
VNPWYFPTVEEYRHRLEAQGFVVSTIALIPRPTPLPGDIVGWLETFVQSFMAPVPKAERAAFLVEVAELCRSTLCDSAGQWTVDYVRLRFAAMRPMSST